RGLCHHTPLCHYFPASCLKANGRKTMRSTIRNLIAGAALAAVPMMVASTAAAQAPTPAPPPPAPLMPPSLVPSLSVNLMTAEGSAAFGAVWRTTEANVVETTAMAGRMPGENKTYDMVPHA